MEDRPRKKAVALRYDPEKDTIPRVTAKGSGTVARKIIELAIANDIPIKEDMDLVEVLSKLDLQEEIPPEIYVAVAELLAFIYTLNKKKVPRPG